MNTSDTIIATATAIGEGGIAVIRISGPGALAALQRFFRPSRAPGRYQSHRLYHGILVDQKGEHLDEVLAVFMAAPHTYTRDDVVEIHCHGGYQVIRQIITLYVAAGLRQAGPGEFTYRAFINGRLDLSQAEAISQLIHARSESSRKLALAQVEGQLSTEIRRMTEALRQLLVFVEAWIDFPEEELPEEDLQRLHSTVKSICIDIDRLTDTFTAGRVLREGASILLLGKPNVGKSSLLNSLLGEERAIVTDIPGTTRDLLEEGLTIGGVPVRLIDTAGLRLTTDTVESEGVRRAERKIAEADLVLFLVDGSRHLDEEDYYVQRECEGRSAFLVVTKQDRQPQVVAADFGDFPRYPISVKSGQGLDALREGIADFLLGGRAPTSGSVLLSEQRHYDALTKCRQSLESFIGGLSSAMPLECLALDLREGLNHLGQISGETTTDQLLEKIFSSFCIGK